MNFKILNKFLEMEIYGLNFKLQMQGTYYIFSLIIKSQFRIYYYLSFTSYLSCSVMMITLIFNIYFFINLVLILFLESLQHINIKISLFFF